MTTFEPYCNFGTFNRPCQDRVVQLCNFIQHHVTSITAAPEEFSKAEIIAVALMARQNVAGKTKEAICDILRRLQVTSPSADDFRIAATRYCEPIKQMKRPELEALYRLAETYLGYATSTEPMTADGLCAMFMGQEVSVEEVPSDLIDIATQEPILTPVIDPDRVGLVYDLDTLRGMWTSGAKYGAHHEKIPIAVVFDSIAYARLGPVRARLGLDPPERAPDGVIHRIGEQQNMYKGDDTMLNYGYDDVGLDDLLVEQMRREREALIAGISIVDVLEHLGCEVHVQGSSVYFTRRAENRDEFDALVKHYAILEGSRMKDPQLRTALMGVTQVDNEHFTCFFDAWSMDSPVVMSDNTTWVLFFTSLAKTIKHMHAAGMVHNQLDRFHIFKRHGVSRAIVMPGDRSCLVGVTCDRTKSTTVAMADDVRALGRLALLLTDDKDRAMRFVSPMLADDWAARPTAGQAEYIFKHQIENQHVWGATKWKNRMWSTIY